MKVAVLRYNAGNIQSIAYALDRLGYQYILTNSPDEVSSADKVIFPGVGEANTTMAFLKNQGLDRLIPTLRQPVLGICLGMQLLCRHSEENDTWCLNIFDLPVKRFKSSQNTKVPHMGWNKLVTASDWIPDDVLNEFVYFAHTYYVPTNLYTAATSEHGTPFSAAMRKDNFYAVQFHPEKSGDVGASILKTFLDL